jgi:hypothetical protein
MDSSTITAIAIVVAIIAIAVAVAVVLVNRRNSARLRSRFGPEYDRMVDDAGSRRRAEAELHQRQRRVAHFEIRPLSPSDRDRFIGAWRSVQAEFVDRPQEAVIKADGLLTEVMRARGYPMEDFEQRSADLSVDHPTVVQHYRAGRAIAVGQAGGHAGTEDLRQAMIHFRSLFDELAGEVSVSQSHASRGALQ